MPVVSLMTFRLQMSQGHSVSFTFQTWNEPFPQGALIPLSEKGYLEATIWEAEELNAIVLSLPLSYLCLYAQWTYCII